MSKEEKKEEIKQRIEIAEDIIDHFNTEVSGLRVELREIEKLPDADCPYWEE